METAGQRDFPGADDITGPKVGADESVTTGLREMAKTFSWKPGKDTGDSGAEEDEVIFRYFKDLELDDEDFESEGYNVPSDGPFPEKNLTPYYESEDWDKELAESENKNSPYDSDDVIFCSSVQDWDPVALCSVQEEPLYDPSCHHVSPVAMRHLKTTPVDGQFDDAVY